VQTNEPDSLGGRLLTPQQDRVLAYLKEGKTLTNKVALTCLDVGSLSSRIAELRKLGYKINAEMKQDHAERGYKAYKLANPEGQPPSSP